MNIALLFADSTTWIWYLGLWTLGIGILAFLLRREIFRDGKKKSTKTVSGELFTDPIKRTPEPPSTLLRNPDFDLAGDERYEAARMRFRKDGKEAAMGIMRGIINKNVSGAEIPNDISLRDLFAIFRYQHGLSFALLKERMRNAFGYCPFDQEFFLSELEEGAAEEE